MTTKKLKAHPFDCVILLEELPQYGLCKGSQGAVVEVYTRPFEAYDIEFVDGAGNVPKLASALLPEQFEVYWREWLPDEKKG